MIDKNKIQVFIFFVIAFAFFLNNSCKKDETNTLKTITDINGNEYHIVTIGTQTWMTENLKVTKYNDGSVIPNVIEDTIWNKLTSGAYCNYDNLENNSEEYGRLYNWYAVNSGKLCPTGWHVPSDAEWTTLTNYLGGESLAGGKLKETGTLHWISPNTASSNETSFSALPGGYRFANGDFGGNGLYGYWWCTPDSQMHTVWYRHMGNSYNSVYRNSDSKLCGFSVRCLKD